MLFKQSFTIACVAAVALTMTVTYDADALREMAQAAQVATNGDNNSTTPSKQTVSNLMQLGAKKATEVRGEMLAQVTAGSSGHDCTFAHRRNKAELVDYYAIQSGSEKYSDDDFTPDDSALFWDDMNEDKKGLSSQSWNRAGEIFSDHSLFGDNGVTPADVRQGALGNCWLLSALAAVAEVPGRVENVFVTRDVSDNGIYAVNFFALGIPHTVIIDDFLPSKSWDGTTYYTEYAKVGPDDSLFVPLLEKAFSKYHGNYAHTSGGWYWRAARTLTGAPWDLHYHENYTTDSLWDFLLQKDNEKDMIQTHTSGASDEYFNSLGLVELHAYTTLGVVELSTGDKLVKMRNPWASEHYHAAWCDSCSEWNNISAADKELAGFTNANDGVFFMPIQLYYDTFDLTSVNHDVSDWYNDYFLMLGDNTQSDNPGDTYYCGSLCTKHTLTLTSEVEQKVWVSAHTWDQRSMGNTCTALWDYNQTFKSHSIKVPHETWPQWFSEGEGRVDPFLMKPNEPIDITVEFDFTDSQVSKDWSVVMYAPLGAVSVKYKDEKYHSDSFPLLDANGDNGGDGSDGSDNKGGDNGENGGNDGNVHLQKIELRTKEDKANTAGCAGVYNELEDVTFNGAKVFTNEEAERVLIYHYNAFQCTGLWWLQDFLDGKSMGGGFTQSQNDSSLVEGSTWEDFNVWKLCQPFLMEE